MLQSLKLKGDENDIFVSSDLHIWQSCLTWSNPLWKRRGYEDKESHRSGIIKIWNSVCKNTSTCILLGDNVFEDEKGEEFTQLLHDLNFKKIYLLLGNHNSGHGPIYKKVLSSKFPNVFAENGEVYPLEWNLAAGKTAVFLPQYAEAFINNQFYALSHYPMISHNKMAKGSIHLSGHCHGNLPLTHKDTGKGLRVDCGWDVWEKPVSIAEIKCLVRHRGIDAYDHHR